MPTPMPLHSLLNLLLQRLKSNISLKIFTFLLLLFFLLSLGNGCAKLEPGNPPLVLVSMQKNAPRFGPQVAYFLLIDRFFNGDPKDDNQAPQSPSPVEEKFNYQGGDLLGLYQKLDYLAQLNVNTIIFTPIIQNRPEPFFGKYGHHGYWPVDYFKIDPRLGRPEDFNLFNQKRISLGINLWMDIVLNHVDYDHPWVKEFPHWFHQRPTITNWDDPIQLTTGKVAGLPDLNQSLPPVYEKLLAYTKHWIEVASPQGLRFDAVKHVGHDFWRKFLPEIHHFATVTKKIRPFLLLAEVLHGDPEFYRPYIADGFNAFYDYPTYYVVKEVFAENAPFHRLIARRQQLAEIFPSHLTLATFLDNHDTPRFLSLNEKVTHADLNQALVYLLTTRGVPQIYYGTESYLTGKDAEEGRGKMPWDQQNARHLLTKLNGLRLQSPACSEGIHQDLLVSNEHYVYRKVSDQEELIVAFNRAPKARKIIVNLGEGSAFLALEVTVDLLSGRKFAIDGTNLVLQMAPKDVVLLRKVGPTNLFQELQAAQLASPMVDIQIYAKAPHRGKLFLVGNRPELGQWNVQNALGPFTQLDPYSYAIKFQTSAHTMLEFKLIIKAENGEILWQPTENHFALIESQKQTIYLQWHPRKGHR